MKVIDLPTIREALASVELLPTIEAGFVAYSEGRSVVPPVGELVFTEPPGDVHIKYGYIAGDDYYVIKVASGFYDNPKLKLPSGDGLMLLFSQRTGELLALLLDRGHLTDLRTAAAGAIAAKYLAPRAISRIGIVGTGTQARLQLEHLAAVTECRDAVVWGRSAGSLARYREAARSTGFSINVTLDARDVAVTCDLIVTTTPSTAPLLRADDIRPGTHITAVGSDTSGKQELDPEILGKAHLVVADSIAQCLERGEIHHAIASGHIGKDRLVELGDVIAGKAAGRTSNDQITVADLTGVAVQDIQISKAVYETLGS
jgi:ornithine cyclodeaminase